MLDHAAAKLVPATLPRVPGGNHMLEWVRACKGGQPVFSDFDVGGHVTEVCLTAMLPLRAGRPIKWNGEQMKAVDAPEADKFIRPEIRKKWLM